MQSKKLLFRGLNDFFGGRGDKLSDDDLVLSKSLLPNILKILNDPCDLSTLSKSVIYGYISNNNEIGAYNLPLWKKDIDSCSELISSQNIRASHWDLFYDHRRRFNGVSQPHHSFPANKISGLRSWSSIGMELALSMQHPTTTSSYILSEWIIESEDGFVDHVESECFGKKYQHKVRGVFYKALSSSGLLTKKQARKMRSEASSAASLMGLNSLMENKDLYDNYDELITQFMDTRYEDVAHSLARSAPIHMVSYLLGSEHYWAKSVAEKRFNEYYKSKEDE
tara:strand:- start:6978 stop:7820 length:843 start_codon:yes stop_codon:yes gene_type:complete